MLSAQILKMCAEAGVEVSAVIDPKKIGTFFHGKEVVDMPDIEPGSKVLIGVLNNFVNVSEIVTQLAASGAEYILTPPEVFFDFGARGLTSEWYWLDTDKSKVQSLANATRALLNPLLDDFSACTLDAILSYRCSGALNEDYVLDLENQYFDTGISNFWDGSISLLDGGAFDGDTITSASRFNVSLDQVFAFEPDPENYEKLVSNTLDFSGSIKTFLGGLSDKTEMVSFNFTSGTGSSLDATGQTVNTKMFNFDSLSPDNKVTHVKLDVEGGEFKALMGMRKTIEIHNPKLAISVYHKPQDLLALPQLIMELGNYKKFSLRNYARQSFETIFYAC